MHGWREHGEAIAAAFKHGATPARVRIAWLLRKPAVAATALQLEPEDIDYLEALYRPLDNLLYLGIPERGSVYPPTG